jgi:hypothetical protein
MTMTTPNSAAPASQPTFQSHPFAFPAIAKKNPKAWPKRPLIFTAPRLSSGQTPTQTQEQHLFYKLKPAANPVAPVAPSQANNPSS